MEPEATRGMIVARREMMDEARRLIDAARSRGVVLRLFGGLAVRDHCELAYVCDRDYSDIDLIGLRRQVKAIFELFGDLGYKENYHVRAATSDQQLQFYRRCDHADAERHFFIHPDDHVDVFLDTFRMDHVVPLADRLEIEDYTISLSDVLLTKLQTVHLDNKDERDIVSLLGEAPVSESDERGAVNVAYIARLCAGDWGLSYDVLAGMARVRDVVESRDDLSPELVATVRAALDRLSTAIQAAPKSAKWRLRAKLGTRVRWHEDVEEQDAAEHGPPLSSPSMESSARP
jgi:hypothetical protein